MEMDSKQIVSDILQELLGCVWGREIMTPDDQEKCANQATSIVVIYNGPRECALKLCQLHKDRVLAETTPHEEDEQ